MDFVRFCKFQGDVCVLPANGFRFGLAMVVGVSDWVEYNFDRLIPYRVSTAGVYTYAFLW